MANRLDLRKYVLHPGRYALWGMIGAVAYSIAVVIFLSDPDYEKTWILYVGNLLFLFAILGFLYEFNRRRDENAGTLTMLAAGHIATVVGIIFACFLSFILLPTMVPGYLAGNPQKNVTGEPANTTFDNTSGVGWVVFATAVIGNMAAGSAISIILPFALKADQTREKVPRRKQAEL
jgi:hypothetical protein